jgi:hypothetical protein
VIGMRAVERAVCGAVARCVLVALAVLCALFAPSRARADLPGTISASAADGGNLWWIAYRRANSAIPAGQQDRSRGEEYEFLLMHHAEVEPAPTERLVDRYKSMPAGLAAEGAEIVVMFANPQGLAGLSMRAVQNPALGHWYTEPRGGPRILPTLAVAGELRSLALVEGAVHALVRMPRTSQSPETLRLFRLVGAIAGPDAWKDLPLPPMDPAEPIRLVGLGGRLHATGFREGSARVAEFRDGAWHERVLEVPAGALPPRGLLGLVSFGGREALVTRMPSTDGTTPTRIGLMLLRQDSAVPWASFPEPGGPWSVGGFGANAALLTLDGDSRGLVATISPASSEPGAAVALAPPGFAARRWVHLPILGILSIAIVLAALIFGSGGYAERQSTLLDARRAAEAAAATRDSTTPDDSIDLVIPAPPRPRGAGLPERGAAFAIDLAPGILAAWLWVGGNPLDLVQLPILATDLEKAQPALVALGFGWLLATIGDAVFGRSLGKRLLRLRIVDARTGAPASLGRRLVRSLLSAVAVASPFVMLLATLHPFGDGPAEMLSFTAVVPDEQPSADDLNPGPGPSDGV